MNTNNTETDKPLNHYHSRLKKLEKKRDDLISKLAEAQKMVSDAKDDLDARTKANWLRLVKEFYPKVKQ